MTFLLTRALFSHSPRKKMAIGLIMTSFGFSVVRSGEKCWMWLGLDLKRPHVWFDQRNGGWSEEEASPHSWPGTYPQSISLRLEGSLKALYLVLHSITLTSSKPMFPWTLSYEPSRNMQMPPPLLPPQKTIKFRFWVLTGFLLPC